MEESRKKPIMIGVIVVCLVAAAVIAYMTRSGGGFSQPRSYLIKCKECGAEYKMDKDDYAEAVRLRVDPKREGVLPPLVCEECGQEAVHRAVKCEKCGEIFFYNPRAKDFKDRCPKCSFSKAEEDWKRRIAE